MTDRSRTTPGSTRSSTAAHLAPPTGAVLRADDVSPATCPASTSSTAADLYVHDGEMVGIIGPNGAGKSTLLKAMFGLVNVRPAR